MKRGGLWCGVAGLVVVLEMAGCTRAPLDFQKTLQERLIAAKPGDVIDLPEGKFHLDRTMSLTVNGVTIRGRGMNKTVLSFAGQKTGAQGMLVKADDFLIEDVGIEDTAGDALTVQGGNNITIRRVRAEWTRGPNEANGPYGIYPVECKNLLLEDSVAKGAADAGIYVGQSENVVIRRNRAELNVDGYEIENSEPAGRQARARVSQSDGRQQHAQFCAQKPGPDPLPADRHGHLPDGDPRRGSIQQQDHGK